MQHEAELTKTIAVLESFSVVGNVNLLLSDEVGRLDFYKLCRRSPFRLISLPKVIYV